MTLRGHSSTFLHRLLGPHSLHRQAFLGRSPDRRPSTPTWATLPAPWPKAAAPPQWERASRPGRRLTPHTATKKESPVRSWRPIPPRSAHHLSWIAPPWLLHILCRPFVLPRTRRPLASPFWSSLSARAAASVWKGSRAPVCLQLPDTTLRSILELVVSQPSNLEYVRSLETQCSGWLWAYFAVCSSCQTSFSQFGSFFSQFTTSEAKEILSFREVFEYTCSPHCYNFIPAVTKRKSPITINLTYIWSKFQVKQKWNDYPDYKWTWILTFPSSFKEPGAAAVGSEDPLPSKQALGDSPHSGLCKFGDFNLKNLILSLTLLPRLYFGW